MAAVIRDYRDEDAGAVRDCVVALQDFERAIDPRLRPGAAMADGYCERMRARCRTSDGRLFVAELNGAVAGFVAVVAREPFTELDELPGTCAWVTDLIVLAPYRGRGIGGQLLARAETFARDAGAGELRIGVLAANTAARSLPLGAVRSTHRSAHETLVTPSPGGARHRRAAFVRAGISAVSGTV
jgi:GNAT superfamily N-acetyltransferase